MPEKRENLATVGTETFKLEQDKERVIINIQEDKNHVLLSDMEMKSVPSGNPVSDFINKANAFLVKNSTIKTQDKSTFFHLLSVMVASGIPMVKSLKSLVMQSEESLKLKLVLESIVEAVESGESLSEAMQMHRDVFNEQEIGMIESGEASGQLAGVLENLAKDTQKAYEIKSKVKSALMYPSVLFGLLIAVVAAMMIFVVPKLSQLFASMGEDLPAITKAVVAISNFFVNQTTAILLIVLVGALFIIFFKKTDIGRLFFDKVKITMPVFGPLFKKAYLSRFARSLSNLLDSNVSIIRTMEITANSIGNEVYRRRIMLAIEDIKQGIPLAENLSESPLFPPMLVSMIQVGEETAQMDTITAQVAEFYENEVDTAVAGISKIIEPIVLIAIGLTVGAIVAAIMLPIMKLSNLAGTL